MGDLRTRSPEYRPKHDVAIIGASCRFPGANCLAELWEVVSKGKDLLTLTPPADRYYMGPWEIPRPRSYLSCSIEEFDAAFFNLSGRQAELMDPQLRLFLEVAWESLEDAGIPPSSLWGTETGVFAGVSFNEYQEMSRAHLNSNSKMHSFMGTEWSAFSGFLSFFLGLNGPSITTESACASSGSAICEAVKALRGGECRVGIVGGVHLRLRNEVNLPDAIFGDACRAFDESANGFAMAEGVGTVVLKLLGDATRDGDRILGVIKGIKNNNNGATNSFGSPSTGRQVDALREALQDAEIEPHQISFFLAHGTGTRVGDPVEAEGIVSIFGPKNQRQPRSQPLLLTSPKTNFGHPMGASGIHSLLYVLLCLQHSKIPRIIHFKRLNPKINFDSIPVRIASEPLDWSTTGDAGFLQPRLAAFNNSGLTGSNVCVVMAEAPPLPFSHQIQLKKIQIPTVSFIPISAKSQASLLALSALLASKLGKDGVELENLAFSLQTTRDHHPIRACILAANRSEALQKLSSAAFDFEGKVRNLGDGPVESFPSAPIGFLFTGQGTEYFGMGHNLYLTSPTFRNILNLIAAHFEAKLGVSLFTFLWEDRKVYDSAGPRLRQPAFFSLQWALTQFWLIILGLEKPSVVLGHSLGEICAGVCAGILSFQDAFTAVTFRGSLTEKLPPGGMMAIGTSKEEIIPVVEAFNKEFAPSWVDLAALNSGEQCVVSGPQESLAQFSSFIKINKFDWRTKILNSTHAFHSRHLDSVLEEYKQVLDKLSFRQPCCQFVSSVTGQLTREFNSDYWLQNIRRPVDFQGGVATLRKLPNTPTIYIEIGPNPILCSMVAESGGEVLTLCPSLRSAEADSWKSILKSVGKIYTNWNGRINWRVFNEGFSPVRIDLPFYPFNRKVYNCASAIPSTWAQVGQVDNFGNNVAPHPVLGHPHPVPGSLLTAFSNSLILANPSVSFIKEHVICGEIVLPGASFLEVLLTLQNLYFPGYSLRNVSLLKPLLLTPGHPVSTQVRLREEGGEYQVSMWVDEENGQELYFTGFIANIPNIIESAKKSSFLDLSFLNSSTGGVDIQRTFYPQIHPFGLEHSGRFQCLETAWSGESYDILSLRIPDDNLQGGSPFSLHPIVLDGMVQALCVDTRTGGYIRPPFLSLPAHYKQFHFYAPPPPNSSLLYVKLDNGRVEQMELYDSGGKLLAQMEVSLLITTRDEFLESLGRNPMPTFFKEEWIQVPNSAALPIGTDVLMYKCDESAINKVGSAANNTGPLTNGGEVMVNNRRPLVNGEESLVNGAGSPVSNKMWPVNGVGRVVNGGGQLVANGVASSPTTNNQPWLIFISNETASIGFALKKLLFQTQKMTSVLVSAGEDFVSSPSISTAVMSPFNSSHFESLRKTYPSVQGVLSCWALGHDWWTTPSEFTTAFLNLMKMVQMWSPEQFVLVTRGVLAGGPQPVALSLPLFPTIVHGMLKTFITEYPSIGGTTIDLDPLAKDEAQDIAMAILDKLVLVGQEREVVIRGDAAYVARLNPFSPALPIGELHIPEEPFRLVPIGYGKSKSYSTQPIKIDTSSTVVRVHAVSLNFIDVVAHRSLLTDESAVIGTDFAGIVVNVGANSRFSLGDRVCGIYRRSAPICSHIREEDALFLARIPQSLNLNQGATLPVAFATALFGMIHVGELIRGERVLIHTASGGFGLAAIQLAQQVGALVYVTAGSEMKRNYLREVLGLVHVYDSRSTSYMKEILRDTEREGVDLVMNTLTAPGFKEATLALVKHGGRFIELSKLDIWSVEQVSDYRPDVHYAIYDTISEPKEREIELEQLFSRDGQLTALPYTLSSLSSISANIQKFGESRHIGKFVLEVLPGKPHLFHAENSYLVTGGLGGIGMKVATWLLKEGAGKVFLTSRRSPTDPSILEQLNSFGTKVSVLSCNVGNEEEVKALFGEIKQSGLPLKGIFHAAGILSDGIISELDSTAFAIAFESKVDGTLNLHNASLHLNLDYFVLFSSIAANFGFPGQAPYTAGNHFMDTFCKYRTESLGLPTLGINWGGWADVGFASNQLTPEQVKQGTERTGNIWFQAEEGLRGLERAIRLGLNQVTIAKLDAGRIGTAIFPRLHSYASNIRKNKEKVTVGGNEGGQRKDIGREGDILSQMAGEVKGSTEGVARLSLLQGLVEKCVRIFIGLGADEGVDKDQSLSLYGMDSLMELEITNKLSQELAIPIPRNKLRENKTVNTFAQSINALLP